MLGGKKPPLICALALATVLFKALLDGGRRGVSSPPAQALNSRRLSFSPSGGNRPAKLKGEARGVPGGRAAWRVASANGGRRSGWRFHAPMPLPEPDDCQLSGSLPPELRSSSNAHPFSEIRMDGQSDGGSAATPSSEPAANEESTREEGQVKGVFGFQLVTPSELAGPSRLYAWRYYQQLAWDLSKVEPLQTDSQTNKTRILAFCPADDIAYILERGHVDMDRVEVHQYREYTDYMERIKAVKPHVILMDYQEALIEDPDGWGMDRQQAEPVVRDIQRAIDDGEISCQYFLIVGDTILFSRNMALEMQTDGWFINTYLGNWISLPRKPGYYFPQDNMTKYWDDVYHNRNLTTPETFKNWIPMRHFDDPLLGDGRDSGFFTYTDVWG